MQIDEVHVKSDISYKGGKIIAPTLDTEDPLKTVLAIMVSSLHKKWSTIVSLVPLSSTKASNLHLIITSVIDDIEKCGLFVQVLCFDNYPQDVNIFKLFSPDKKTLSPIVPHPVNPTRSLFLFFDPVHILKCIRNWLIGLILKISITLFFAKIAHQLTAKSCWPSSFERQNVNLLSKYLVSQLVLV